MIWPLLRLGIIAFAALLGMIVGGTIAITRDDSTHHDTWIIGMWRQGIGADPHFALGIGETMLRVGQRHIAWAAFERASRMSDKFSADPARQAFLREHCKKRQEKIETSFRTPPSDPHERMQSPPLSEDQIQELRKRFDEELAHGMAYQKAYQDYESSKLARGVALNDPHFYDEFLAGRDPIASPSGTEEWFTFVPPDHFFDIDRERARGWAFFTGGLVALLTALGLNWLACVRADPVTPSPSGSAG